MRALAGKTVVLGVTGGISAYKAAELCRLLRKADARVRVVMTRAATEFITPLTLQTLSNAPVGTELFDLTSEAEIGHIKVADEADIIIIAPASADAIARMAAGMADDLLTAVVLASKAPLLLAPAMNVNMWQQPIVQDNLRRLIGTGRVRTVGPDSGELACGWIGAGRLVDPAEIAAAAAGWLEERAAPGPLRGRHVIVTAGPTHEAVDDVRFLGNRSSGKMGFALAASAARQGAKVTLVAGPVALATPAGVERRIDITTALELQAVLTELVAGDVEALVMAAAVADFRPAEAARGKLNRRDQAVSTLALTPNPDVLAGLGNAREGARPLLVGFAAEVGLTGPALIARAHAKLKEKRCDVIIANDVSAPGLGFSSDDNAVVIVNRQGEGTSLGPLSKTALADRIWAALAPLISASPDPSPARTS
ncbi:MAG TPA: bifunctional phosphopantothenoylcysteine decarboxylase/phosphopantothenate--cysteine ligase CoaBC [Polyangia bacterium]